MDTDDIIANILDAPESQQQENDHSEINISDVIEVIQTTDPTASVMFPSAAGIDGACGSGGGTGITNMEQYNGNGDMSQQIQLQQQQYQQHKQNELKRIKKEAYVKIIEQPASKALRFRYECEGRSAGSIPGVKSTPENKTFPTIEIVGYKGPAVVVVSCITKDQPYRPHPHNLVGKESCKRGVCTVEIKSDTMRAVFSNLGIQCVKKKDIESALRVREEIRVDPFKTGFSHRFQPSSLDLNSVRLCFQVFVENDKKGRFQFPLPPVVSDPIYDKKAMSDLVICTLCSCSSTVAGGKEIILLCEKVAKEDISVRFFEEHDGQTVWEGYGDFQHTDVHKQTAIKFRTPHYKTLDINQPAKVFIQLRRPSDGATSEPLPFDYLPLDSGRRTFWSLRTNIKGKPDLELFRQILSVDSELNRTPTENSNPISTVIEENTPSPSIKSNEIINLDTPVSDEEKPIVTEEDAKRKSESEVDNIVNEIVKEMEIEQHHDEENISSPISNPPDDVSAVTTIVTSPINAQISNDKTTEWIKSSEFERNDSIQSTGLAGPNLLNPDEDKTLNDLLDQVAELDEIYTDHILRRDTFQNTIANELAGLDNCLPKTDTVEQMDLDEMFDDAATYTSLQKAFKNPISIQMPPTPPASQIASDDTQHFDPVDIIVNPPGPIINMSMAAAAASLKREIMTREEEKLPPLPPKRVKKQDNIENRPIEPMPSPSKSRSANNSPLARPQSQIIIMKTPDQSPPTKKLPPTPTNTNTLPKPKKPGFFSKLFSRRKSKSDLCSTNSSTDNIAPMVVTNNGNSPVKPSPEPSREPSINHFNITDTNRSSLRSLKSLQPTSVTTSPTKDGKIKIGKPVGRSVSSVSDPKRKLPKYCQPQNRMDYQLDQNPQKHDGRPSQSQFMNHFLNIDQSTIKIEPRDSSPSPYMFGLSSYRISEQSPSPQPISPQNFNTPSPYSLGGANGNNNNNNIGNQQLISPDNQFNTTTGGNISPNLAMNGLPDFNPYHQQQPQFGGLNYNTWNNNNNGDAGAIGGNVTPSDIKKNINNNLITTNFNINTTNSNNNNSTNNNNNVQQQQQWNLSAALKQSINNVHMFNFNNTQNGSNQNNLLQTQSNSNSINLGNVNTGEAPNLSSLLDMDSEQLIHLNSAELRGLSLS